MEWIDATAQKPKTQKPVLVAYVTHHGKPAVTMGWYCPAKTLESGDFESEVDDEYDEASDTYYMKEQWVDESAESEYHYGISGVTHWMPLPDLPSNALSQADAACSVSPGADMSAVSFVILGEPASKAVSHNGESSEKYTIGLDIKKTACYNKIHVFKK